MSTQRGDLFSHVNPASSLVLQVSKLGLQYLAPGRFSGPGLPSYGQKSDKSRRFPRESGTRSGTDYEAGAQNHSNTQNDSKARLLPDKLVDDGPTSAEIISRIQLRLQKKETCRPLIYFIRDNEPQKALDLLHIVSGTKEDLDPRFRRNAYVLLQRVSKASGLFPTSCNSLDIDDPEDSEREENGKFGDIFKRQYPDGESLCLKRIRVVEVAADRNKALHKQLLREGIIWCLLRHPNVLPFYGIINRLPKSLPFLVSPWMENGNVNQYLLKKPTMNRFLLVIDISQGLEYLHSREIIHGDLKGANVLVDSCGRARLADFGLSSVFDQQIPHWSTHSMALRQGGTFRWQAPELFASRVEDKDPYNTRESDIYAWSCVCYEIFTEQVPFWRIRREEAVMFQIVTNGLTPERPDEKDAVWAMRGLRGDFWLLMEKCWARDPRERPTLQDLLSDLQSRRPADTRPTSTEYCVPVWAQRVTNHAPLSLLESLRRLDQLMSRVDVGVLPNL